MSICDNSKAYNRMLDHAVLSREEEAELMRLVRSGDKAAADRFVLSNMKLLHRIAAQFLGSRRNSGVVSVEDLVSEGIPALYKAVEGYDPLKGSFSHWARWYVMRAYSEYWRKIGCGPIEASRAMVSAGRTPKVHRLGHSTDSSTGDNPSGFTEHPIDAEMAAMADQMDDSAESAGNAGDVADLMEMVRTRMNLLPERTRRMVTRRFGIDGVPAAGLNEIGAEFKLCGERVRQLTEAALKVIRHSMAEESACTMAS